MAVRILALASTRQRGLAAPILIAIAAILLLVAVGAYLLIIKPSQPQAPAALKTANPAAAKKDQATSPPANVASMSVEQLLGEARQAMRQQRLLAPAGNNAFEYYLKALEKDPNNQVARDALRETFPFGANAAEQEINDNHYEEAQREIDLLAKADPNNYTLTILRSKLDAQRKLAERVEEQKKRKQELAQRQTEQQQKAAEQPSAPEPEPAQNTAPPPETRVATQPPKQAPVQAAPKPKPPPVPAKPAGETRGAKLVKSASPQYPAVAVRRRESGWVDVEFTVKADGSVTGTRVLDARPRHIFDRAATQAVEQWKFQPALKDGEPVSTTLRQRIEFKLGGG